MKLKFHLIAVVSLFMSVATGLSQSAEQSQEKELISFLAHRTAELKKATGEEVDALFWTWFEERPPLKRSFLAGSHLFPCRPSVRAVRHLDHLRRKCPEQVDLFPNLTIGFVASYCYHSKFATAAENLEAFEASFRYYVKNEEDMLYPIRTAPWPLLAHAVSCERPIPEREEILALYKQIKPDRTERINRLNGSYDIPLYKSSNHKPGAPHLKEREAGVAAMKAKGYGNWTTPVMHYSWWGVCNHKSWYAYHVQQMHAIPSFRFSQRNHAWPGSIIIDQKTGKYRFHKQHSYGRMTAPDQYGTAGEARNWNTPYDFTVLTQGMNHDPAAFENAILVAAMMEEMTPEQRRANSNRVFQAAKANPWVPILRIQFARMAARGEIEPRIMFDIAETMLAPYLKRKDSSHILAFEGNRIASGVAAGIIHHTPNAAAAARAGRQFDERLTAHAGKSNYPLHDSWRNLDGRWIQKHQGNGAAEKFLFSHLTATNETDDFAARLEQLTTLYLARKDGQGLVIALEALRKRIPAYPQGVASEADLPAAPDTIPWKQTHIPSNFKTQGFDIDGVVWYTTTVKLDSSMAGKDLTLHLGTIDDADVTYWNGSQIGATNHHTTKRSYKISAEAARFGRNTLTVRVQDNRSQGGFTGKDEELFLARSSGGKTVKLAGNWNYWILQPDPRHAKVTKSLITALQKQKLTTEAAALQKILNSLGQAIHKTEEIKIEGGNTEDPAYRQWLEEVRKRTSQQ